MKLKQLREILQKTTPEVRKKVYKHLALLKIMEENGLTIKDINEINKNHKSVMNKVLSGNDSNVKTIGVDGQLLKITFQKAIIGVGVLLDEGGELDEAIKKTSDDFVKELEKIYVVKNLDITYEQQVRKGFEYEIKKIFVSIKDESGKPKSPEYLDGEEKASEYLKVKIRKSSKELNDASLKLEEVTQNLNFAKAEVERLTKLIEELTKYRYAQAERASAFETLEPETKNFVKTKGLRTVEEIIHEREKIKGTLKAKWKSHLKGGSAGGALK